MTSLRVLLADDHTLFLRGIEALLTWRGGFQVVGRARDGLEAVALARETRPDLILMDVDMPRCGGLEAVRRIKHERPEARIIMLTVSDAEDDLFEAIKSGAQGYLLKDLEPDQLIQMLQGVARGEAAFSGVIAAKMLEEFTRLSRGMAQGNAATSGPVHDHVSGPADAQPVEPLSDREMEVLTLLVSGLTNQEIAETLVVTANTVKTHLSNILAKLQLQNRVQLAVYAVRQQLV